MLIAEPAFKSSLRVYLGLGSVLRAAYIAEMGPILGPWAPNRALGPKNKNIDKLNLGPWAPWGLGPKIWASVYTKQQINFQVFGP